MLTRCIGSTERKRSSPLGAPEGPEELFTGARHALEGIDQGSLDTGGPFYPAAAGGAESSPFGVWLQHVLGQRAAR